MNFCRYFNTPQGVCQLSHNLTKLIYSKKTVSHFLISAVFSLRMTVQEAQSLFQAAKENQPGAFESLYEGLFSALYRYILLSVRHRETAEDLTQNLFIKALNLTEKNSDIQFLPYLYAMARNSIIDHVRVRKDLIPDTPLEEAFRDTVSEIPAPDQIVQEADRSEEIAQALSALEATEREVITLRFFSDLSHRDIALVMGKSEANVRQIQSRALKKLRTTHQHLFTR